MRTRTQLLYILTVLLIKTVQVNAQTANGELRVLKGTINSKIPVFVWYKTSDSLLFGQIVYLNTRQKTPIRIIGSLSKDGCRILEFEKSGNISGIINGHISNGWIGGSWFSPASRKEMAIQLQPFDTVINPNVSGLAPSIVDGEYGFKYGKKGRSGYFKVERIDSRSVSFEIQNDTGEPAYNQAIVETDTVSVKTNNFIYSPDGVERCRFLIRLFNEFVCIDYMQFEGCEFGHNASVDGMYLRIENVH